MTMTADGYHLYTPRRFNATTKPRFFRDRSRGLVEHLGGNASRAQLTLIRRIVQNEWDLLRLDAQMDAGEISAHAMRNRLAMENRLRLDLRDLGLKPATDKQPTLAEYLAAKRACQPGDAAA